MEAIIRIGAQRPVLPEFPDYGICILESRHGEGFTMPPSRYDFSEVMLVLDGAGWIVHGGTRHPLRPRDVIVVPRRASYRIQDQPGRPLAILCLCIRPPTPEFPPWKDVLPKQLSVRRNLALGGAVAGQLRTILFEQSCPRIHSGAVVTAQTLLLLAKLQQKQYAPAPREPQPREIEIRARVQNHIHQLKATFHESETIPSVAARLGISAKSLTAHFRMLTGTTRRQYIQSLRIAHACHRLTLTDESVASVSFACGFEDLSTFFRAFRQEMRMSPTQWRSRSCPLAPRGRKPG